METRFNALQRCKRKPVGTEAEYFCLIRSSYCWRITQTSEQEFSLQQNQNTHPVSSLEKDHLSIWKCCLASAVRVITDTSWLERFLLIDFLFFPSVWSLHAVRDPVRVSKCVQGVDAVKNEKSTNIYSSSFTAKDLWTLQERLGDPWTGLKSGKHQNTAVEGPWYGWKFFPLSAIKLCFLLIQMYS